MMLFSTAISSKFCFTFRFMQRDSSHFLCFFFLLFAFCRCMCIKNKIK